MMTTKDILFWAMWPFLAGGLMLLALKACVLIDKALYRRAQRKRDALLMRLGIKPFPGTKEFPRDRHY